MSPYNTFKVQSIRCFGFFLKKKHSFIILYESNTLDLRKTWLHCADWDEIYHQLQNPANCD